MRTFDGVVRDIVGEIAGQTGDWDYDPSLPRFGRDGRIVFSTRDGIYRVNGSGGTPDLLIPARPGEGPLVSPTMLPSGETVLFTIAPIGGGLGMGTIVAQSLKTGQRTRLLTGSQPHFDRTTGQLLYMLGGRVLAAALDPDTLAVSGASVPVVGNVLVTVDDGAQFAMSDQGTLIYTPGRPGSTVRRQLLWVDRQGRAVPLPIPASAFEAPRLSPNGRAVAAAIRDVITDVWKYDLVTGSPLRLTGAAPSASTPIWTPDGRAVSVAVEGPGVVSGLIDAPDRPPARLWGATLGDSRQPLHLSAWDRDGRVLAGTQQGDLWLLDTVHPARVHPEGAAAAHELAWSRALLIRTPFTERDPVFSPDGRWIAYSSDRSGSNEIYVQSYPALGEPQRVTNDGDAVEPLWSGNGREIFYRRHEAMMSVIITSGATVTAGPPRQLFDASFASPPGGPRGYDASPDGQHFVMVGHVEPEPVVRELSVLRHWSAKLRR